MSRGLSPIDSWLASIALHVDQTADPACRFTFVEEACTYNICYSLETNVATIVTASPEPPATAFESARPHVAPAQGAGRGCTQERRLSPSLLARSLRAVPVAGAGSAEGPRRSHSPQAGARREREADRHHPALSRGAECGLSGADGPLPEARGWPPRSRGGGDGAPRARARSTGRHRLLRCSGPPAGPPSARSRRAARDRIAQERSAPDGAARSRHPPEPAVGHAAPSSRGPYRVRVAHQAVPRSGSGVRLCPAGRRAGRRHPLRHGGCRVRPPRRSL